MYQFIVVGLGLLLIVGGGFLIKVTDSNSEGVLSQAFSSKPDTSAFSPSVETITGIYSCDKTSGCLNPKDLTLNATGGAQLVTGHDDGTDPLKEVGTWKLEQGGLITVALSDSTLEHYEIPHILLIQSVMPGLLSRISYDAKIYTDMHKPAFVRQEEGATQ